MSELQPKYKQLLDIIEAHETIIIIPHARPDGDCLGSALGLKDIITTSYPEKKVFAIGDETGYLKFLGKLDVIEDDVFKEALVIAVDTANQERLADQRYTLGKTLAKIDHHINVDSYGDLEIVDTTSPAAAQMIMDFYTINESKLNMTAHGAQALFTGILTDTGRFKYDGVSQRTFLSVAKLYENGLDPKPVYEALEVMSESLIRFRGYVLLNYKKTDDGVAYIKITKDLCDEFKVTTEEASSLVNELSHFEDAPIWVLFNEYEEEKVVRARIRSKGPNISVTANGFNGGGHAKASGANLGTWEVADELLKALNEVAKTYKLEQK